jgi:hypothetical protein
MGGREDEIPAPVLLQRPHQVNLVSYLSFSSIRAKRALEESNKVCKRSS